MGSVTGDANGSLDVNKAVKETVNGQPNKELIFGDMLWIKLRKAKWWPAQVVDENSVPSGSKPSSKGKGSNSDVLVRLYGSYIYKYVDVNSSRANFKTILEENKFNHDDIMMKTLKKDLASLNGSSKKRKQDKPKEPKASQDKSSKKDVSDKPQSKLSSKKQKQDKPKTPNPHPVTPDKVTNGIKPSSPNTATLGSQQMSSRRIKVMQSLGLVAPLGSPFPRHRIISPNV